MKCHIGHALDVENSRISNFDDTVFLDTHFNAYYDIVLAELERSSSSDSSISSTKKSSAKAKSQDIIQTKSFNSQTSKMLKNRMLVRFLSQTFFLKQKMQTSLLYRTKVLTEVVNGTWGGVRFEVCLRLIFIEL